MNIAYATKPAKSPATLTSVCKVKLSLPPLPHGIMLVSCKRVRELGSTFFYDSFMIHVLIINIVPGEKTFAFRKRDDRFKLQRKLLGVLSTFGNDCW